MTGRRLRLAAALLLVTAGAGLFAAAFRLSLQLAYRRLYGPDNVIDAMHALPVTWRVLAPLAGATAAGVLARLRGGRPQGVSDVMEAIALGHVRLSLRTTASRIASSWTAIAGGVSIGREGPLIEVGGSVGAGVARALGLALDDTRVLVAAGTAAGFAAAYNTPFAAVLFVLESIAGVAAPALLLPVMAAAVGATAIVRAAVGAGPLYGARAFAVDAPLAVAAIGLLGIAAAIAATAFKRLLLRGEQWVAAHPLPQPWRAMLGGAVVGLGIAVLPDVAGNGYETINRLLDAPPAVTMLIVIAAAKVVVTSAAVASGIPGGVFTPMLLVGAALGSIADHLLPGASAGGYALVGMAAATAAGIHAPLTAAVLIFELTGDYTLVLPLMLSTVVATVVSRALGADSVYEAELRRRGVRWQVTLEGRQLSSPPP